MLAPPAHPDAALLSVRNLSVAFASRGTLFGRSTPTPVVKNVDFEIRPGSVLALVGESGCGKTTVARALLRLLPTHSATVTGSVTFEGQDLLSLSGTRLRAARARVQVVFQDPGGSMNPGMSIADIVSEPLMIHHPQLTPAARLERCTQTLERCGISSSFLHRHPGELSGGQRQRVCIARALMTQPSLLVCDEPTSALDVSVQAQILNLLSDLRASLGLACLFITHDMGVVRQLADHVCVMHSGQIVERGPTDSILDTPVHPYTRQLLDAVPGRGLGQRPGQGQVLPSR